MGSYLCFSRQLKRHNFENLHKYTKPDQRPNNTLSQWREEVYGVVVYETGVFLGADPGEDFGRDLHWNLKGEDTQPNSVEDFLFENYWDAYAYYLKAIQNHNKRHGK